MALCLVFGAGSVCRANIPESTTGVTSAPALRADLKIAFLPSSSVERGNNSYRLDELSPIPSKIRNRLFAMVPLLAGCRPASDGHCNVTVEYRMIDPTGKSIFVSPRRNAWVGEPLSGEVKPGSDGIEGGFDSVDPPGDYKIAITLFDNVANVQATAERILHLEASD